MSKYKIGDKVKTDCESALRFYPKEIIGKVGTVIAVIDQSMYSSYLLEFDQPFRGGHDGNDVCPGIKGKPGCCWWIIEKYLVKDDNIEAEDLVKVVSCPEKEFLVNQIAKVVGVDIGDTILVEFDKPFPGGHAGHGEIRGTDGCCWWFSREDLELVSRSKCYTKVISSLSQIEILPDDVLEQLSKDEAVRFVCYPARFNKECIYNVKHIFDDYVIIEDQNKKLYCFDKRNIEFLK